MTDMAFNRTALQWSTGALALIPLATGALTMMGVRDPLYGTLQLPANALLDSNLRFFGGVWLGLGVSVLWMIPRIEQNGVLFRALWGMIFLGGIGRLLSVSAVGWPPIPFVVVTGLEIVGAPLFVIWQRRMAQAWTA